MVSNKRPTSYQEQIEVLGFAILPKCLEESQLTRLTSALTEFTSDTTRLEKSGSVYGIRNILTGVPEVAALATSKPVRDIVESILGPEAAAVRGLFFDKTKDANWPLGWHQDLSIAVKERQEAPGFGPWSTKAGIPHVIAPENLLKNMLTLRIHLDDCPAENGALKVIPGSHHLKGLSMDDCNTMAEKKGIVICEVERGDVLIMRPLIVHASDKSAKPGHRRVVHLGFAASNLPAELTWNEFLLPKAGVVS